MRYFFSTLGVLVSLISLFAASFTDNDLLRLVLTAFACFCAILALIDQTAAQHKALLATLSGEPAPEAPADGQANGLNKGASQ